MFKFKCKLSYVKQALYFERENCVADEFYSSGIGGDMLLSRPLRLSTILKLERKDRENVMYLSADGNEYSFTFVIEYRNKYLYNGCLICHVDKDTSMCHWSIHS